MLKEILRYLQLCGASATVTMGLASITKPPARLVRADGGELRRILDTADPWLRCFCIIAGHHGLRLAEALRLSAAHYNSDQGTITYGTKNFQRNTLPSATNWRNISGQRLTRRTAKRRYSNGCTATESAS